ncbi:WD40 repeat-like protein [Sistotremastrum suecicum HHB10207 ss-3]|uniref:WD40 repeat-like protein n=1 Tax=Sistotremastrum suecicum HHB10207 ss-3 TaxID=1314776 RepID=A0A166EAM6_9AGAM|nr:WD40 repeat-like protein [Sistotremastrum suecicum HHB10207 ss-3]
MAASATHDEIESDLSNAGSETTDRFTLSDAAGELYVVAKELFLSSQAAGTFLVEFECVGRKERTAWSKSTKSQRWTSRLTFPWPSSGSDEVLKIRVFHRKKGVERLRCECEDIIGDPRVSEPLEKWMKVWKWVEGNGSELRLSFCISLSTLAPDAVDRAASEDLVLPTVLDPSPAIEDSLDRIDHLADGASVIQPIEASLGAVIEAVDPTMRIVEDICKIHPYAKLAFSVVTAAYKAVKAQRDRDNEMNGLITIMRETYKTIWDARRRWERRDNLDLVWDKVSVVTVDCCHFICKYRETKNFVSRTFKNVSSRTDETIKDYKAKFQELREAFQGVTTEDIHDAVMNINVIQLKLLEEVRDLHIDMNLNDMIYPTGANFDPQKVCLRGTRDYALHVLRKFAGGFSVEEAATDRDPSILWVRGGAGTGKTFLAHRLVELLTPSHKIGSSFFFNYRNLKDAPPHSLVPRITQDLASAHPAWKHALSGIIGSNRGIRQETSIFKQFELLLLKPALAVHISQPLLFVIDGLDEAGNSKGRSELIEVLATRLHELPPNFRFVLFSRPEQDIVDAFSKHQHHTVLEMQGLCSKDDKDTRKVIEDRFRDLKKLAENRSWLTDDILSLLVLKSGGLMIYARTACDFIIDAHEDGLARQERLDLLLKSDKVPEMDELYRTILNTIISHKTARRRFRATIGRVICLDEPLPFAGHVGLDRGTTNMHASAVIIPKLGSLLDGTNDHSRSISLIHKSFADFVSDRKRSGDVYHVNTSEHNRILLEACLSVMEMDLKFNVCGNTSSDAHLKQDHNSRLISVELEYACNFWAAHLRRTSYDSATAARLQKMCETNLLYWFEVLNHTQSRSANFGRIPQECMERMIEWCQVHFQFFHDLRRDRTHFLQQDNADLTDIGIAIQRCLRDISNFHMESGPHVYLSALPYVAPTNWVHHQYRHLFHHLPVIRSDLWAAEPLVDRVLFQVRDRQTAFSEHARARYSPDGIYILVSSGTHFVLLDSAHYGPIWSKKRELRAWEFSPDGKRIYLLGQSLDLEVIEITDGTCCSSPIRISPTEYTIGAMISPDCRYVICVSRQGTLQKWGTQTGERIISSTLSEFHLFEDDGEVRFSQDGESLIQWGGERSGYQIGYWSAESPSPMICKGRTARIRRAICSLDNARLFFHDGDCTIGAWNLHSGQEMWHSEVHEQLRYPIECLAASPDNQLVASGSENCTIRLWDATTGHLICKLLQSRRGSPKRLEFSPDGKRLFCITSEGIAYVWNIELALSTPYHDAPPISGGSIYVVQMSTDSSLMAVAVGLRVIQIQETKSAKVLAQKSVKAQDHLDGVLAFSPKNSLLAYSDDKHCIGLWHWQTPEQDHHLSERHNDSIRSLCFSPNAELLLSASDDTTIRVWDIQSGNVLPLRVIPIHTKSPYELDCAFAAIFAQSGNRIVSAHYFDLSLKVWDVDAEDSLKQRIDWPPDQDVKLAVSPNGGRLLSASKERIQVWNIVDGQLSKFGQNLEADHGDVCSAAFSPDSCKVAVAFGDKTIQIWDVETGKKFGAPLHSHCKAQTLAFTPDGRQIMAASTADGLVHTWDIATKPSTLPWKSKPADERWLMPDPWDGWVYDTGPDESRLFWVPERFRPGFVWSDRHHVIGYPETRVDISDFVHGEEWTRCWKGPTSAISDSAS